MIGGCAFEPTIVCWVYEGTDDWHKPVPQEGFITLLRKAVAERRRRSLSLRGVWIFGIAVWDSFTHCLGYSPVVVIVFIMIIAGLLYSAANSEIIFLGRSPLTEEFGFLAFNIFS